MDAGLGCYYFPYRPEQHIYFSCVLSSHFMAEKTICWVKSAALLVLLYIYYLLSSKLNNMFWHQGQEGK